MCITFIPKIKKKFNKNKNCKKILLKLYKLHNKQVTCSNQKLIVNKHENYNMDKMRAGVSGLAE